MTVMLVHIMIRLEIDGANAEYSYPVSLHKTRKLCLYLLSFYKSAMTADETAAIIATSMLATPCAVLVSGSAATAATTAVYEQEPISMAKTSLIRASFVPSMLDFTASTVN